ncbi:MAG TPA: hypothetical protein VIJ44_05905 [Acidimicrobiia bacterium]
MATTDDELRTEEADRDLATLEAAERELADLERDLSRIEGSEDAAAG